MLSTLSIGEYDILNRIVGYGGYVTKEILHLYRKDITQDRCYRILSQLEKKSYIRKRQYFQSSREPNVYQVTRKACAYFGRPEAYMRKVHKAYAVRRYLIRSHFLFALAGAGKSISLFSSEERANYVRSLGFSNYHLPKKINKGTISIQMEEFIVSSDYSKRELTFLYVDNIRNSVLVQLETLAKRYERMQNVQLTELNFIIAAENQDRVKEFQKVYEFQFKKNELNVKTESINRSYQSEIL